MTTDVSRFHPNLGIGLIGGGFMSVVHARAARAAGARIVGVASRSSESAQRAALRLGAPESFETVDELLADPRIDVVHVCSPNVSHADLAGKALAAGKHVVSEKPLATSLEDALELARAAENSPAITSVPFVYRFHPMVREARSRVRSGRAGRVFSVRGAYLQDWLADREDDDWRVDSAQGGPSRAFADIGSHLVDTVEFVTGDRISRLTAQLSTVHPDRGGRSGVDTEDAAIVMFETASGTVGTLNISQVSLGHKNKLSFEIDAERESLAFDQELPDLLRIGTKSGFLTTARGDDLSPQAARYSRVPAGHPQGYQDAFNAFVADTYQAVEDGVRPDGLPTFGDGLRAAVITESVLASSRTGEWVEPARIARTHLAGSRIAG